MARNQADRRRSPDDTAFALYIRQISKTSALSSDREAELAVRIRQGDRSALEELVRANLRFVVSVSRNYQNQGLPLCDLINEGNLGLIRAAKRFDERKNFKFISYAVWWIRQAILQALAEQSRIVKVPLNRVGTIHRIGKTQSKLEQRLRRTPNAAEIAGELKLDVDEVLATLKIGNSHISLDAPMRQGDDHTLIDSVRSTEETPDGRYSRVSLRTEVGKMLGVLDQRERAVVTLYFGIEEDTPLTLEEIGIRLNLTRERVRQIKEKALKRLKGISRTQQFISKWQ
ncbi:MAG: sigma-70 family RNA polymerase sigma factor [Chitinivibrionales bacterium]|nr:sigma-70 family RNA polymerase sigma factor [Chitinivibrionales bacterium]